MTSLLTNASAMTALTTLKGIGAQLDRTSNRIATGLRVAAAADNAAYWSIATAMRTDNASLGAVKDSLGLGSSTVDTAYNGLDAILSNLQNFRSKLQAALQPGIDRSKVQTEIAAIQATMKATADSSVSGGQNWLSVNSDDSVIFRPTQSVVAGFSRDESGNVSISTIDVRVSEIALYDSGTGYAVAPASPARVTAGTALQGQIDLSGTQEVRLSLGVNGALAQDIVLDRASMSAAVPDLANIGPAALAEAINNQIAANVALRGTVRAGLDEDNRLWFETTAKGSGTSLTLDRTSNGAMSATNQITNEGFESGLSGWTLGGTTTYVSVGSSPPAHSGASQLGMGTVGTNATLTQAVSTAAGSTYTVGFWLRNGASSTTPGDNRFEVVVDGTVLLNLQDAPAQPYQYYEYDISATSSSTNLSFNARHDPSFWYLDDITFRLKDAGATLGFGEGPTAHSYGNGSDANLVSRRGILDTVDQTTGFSVQTIDLNSLTDATGEMALKEIISQVDKTIANVTNAGTKLGANKTQVDGQKRFVDTLMKANDRVIGILVDADIEEESVKLRALQTQQQLAVQALGIANTDSQSVMALFRP